MIARAVEAKHAEELVEQAWLCFRLSHEITDQRAILTLRELGRTYIEAALAAGAPADRLPRFNSADEDQRARN